MAHKYKEALTPAARRLRREMTPEERRLWYSFLRDHPVHFYRQRPIGPYIVDFCCIPAKLVIELEGSQHYEGAGPENDLLRTDYLNSRGFTVLRSTNLDIKNSFYGVCTEIQRFLHTVLRKDLPGNHDSEDPSGLRATSPAAAGEARGVPKKER